MAISLRPPKKTHARTGANPTLRTVEFVRAALKAADGPISRNQLMEVLKQWGHATTRRSLNVAIAFLGEDGSVGEGSKGLVWIEQATGKLLEAVRAGRDL
jgi:hypothetical protein